MSNPVKMSEKAFAEFQRKEALEREARMRGRKPGAAPAGGQNVRTNYKPSSGVYGDTRSVEARQADRRRIRREAREAQKPSVKNTVRKIGVTVAGFIDKGNSAVQGAGKRFIDAEDREVPHIRRDARETDQRVRRKIAPNIDMSSSWVLTPTPSAGWLTGSRGPWSTSSMPSVPSVFGLPTSLPGRSKKSPVKKVTMPKKVKKGKKSKS